MKTVTYEIIIVLPLTVIVNEKDSDFAESFSPSNLAEWMLETAKKHQERGEAAVFTVNLP